MSYGNKDGLKGRISNFLKLFLFMFSTGKLIRSVGVMDDMFKRQNQMFQPQISGRKLSESGC